MELLEGRAAVLTENLCRADGQRERLLNVRAVAVHARTDANFTLPSRNAIKVNQLGATPKDE